MSPPHAAFYFDLASPLAYLAAERVGHVFSGTNAQPDWRAVLARELGGGAETFAAHRCAAEREALREDVERRARELGLQPLRWPSPFPFDSSLAMRVAAYAASIGRAAPFAQAAFRQAFAGGHALEDPDYVLIAAAACEMHPAAVLRGAELRSTRERLAASTARAAATGVTDVPAIVLYDACDGVDGGAEVFHGERELERAAERLRGARVEAGAR